MLTTSPAIIIDRTQALWVGMTRTWLCLYWQQQIQLAQFAKMVNMAMGKRYFTANEVAVHNTMEDLWVSFLGKVYDLTPLCQKHKGKNSSQHACSARPRPRARPSPRPGPATTPGQAHAHGHAQGPWPCPGQGQDQAKPQPQARHSHRPGQTQSRSLRLRRSRGRSRRCSHAVYSQTVLSRSIARPWPCSCHYVAISMAWP